MSIKQKIKLQVHLKKEPNGTTTATIPTSGKVYHQQPGSCVTCDVKCGTKLCELLECGEWDGQGEGVASSSYAPKHWKLNPASSCEPCAPCEG